MKSRALCSPPFGKVVADHVYLHSTALPLFPAEWRELVTQAAAIANTVAHRDFNVVKVHLNGGELSLLDYRDFFTSAFPILMKSWRIRIETGSVVFRTYEESLNPPILHRKELLLSPDDPRVSGYKAITDTAESLGLFKNPNRIGFRSYWYQIVAESGYEFDGLNFIPIANSKIFSDDDLVTRDKVQRHLTALSRSNFSAPVQALLRQGLVNTTRTFFDFGCGKGDDVRGLLDNGIDSFGWDPYFCVDSIKRTADVVNIGFVINVIEDISERVEALRMAYFYAKGVMSVAAMLSNQTPPDGRAHGDGYLTSRNTFQKYYSQLQLRDFIESVLDEPAIAAGPGVFFVFKDKVLEQDFLAKRYGRRTNSVLLTGWTRPQVNKKPPKTEHKDNRSRQTVLFHSHEPILNSLWVKSLELGRQPDISEVDPSLANEIRSNIGSINKAFHIASKYFDSNDLLRSTRKKMDDLLVFAALLQFQKKLTYQNFEASLNRSIRYFFRTYTSLQAAARKELFDLTNLERLNSACEDAFKNGFGWLEESHSLQFHTSLLDRLPTILRIYVGCATTLVGDISEFDLIKVHIRSGKVTLLKFEDFEGCPLPRLVKRIKVRLKDIDLDIFEYGIEFETPLLYYKSRFINEEYLTYYEQIRFEEKLDRLELVNLQGHGFSEKDFLSALKDKRWEIDHFDLVRSKDTPNLDTACGNYFSYRQLIECGDTYKRTKVNNTPIEPDSFTALHDLAIYILDPVIEYFGMIELTYGFCSATLARKIKFGIAPHLDQHAGCEKNRHGKPICSRMGAACDFLVLDEDMEQVAHWLIANTPFDRIYFYGKDRPIHVSYSTSPARQLVTLLRSPSGRLVPRVHYPLGKP